MQTNFGDAPPCQPPLDPEAQSVLAYFLGYGDHSFNFKETARTKWFATGEQRSVVDADVTVRFGDVLARALAGELPWRSTVLERLALIVVLDQFSRHVLRAEPDTSPVRSQADRAALQEALELLEVSAWDCGLQMHEFVFAVMPLRHSNDLAQYRRLQGLIDAKEQTLQQQSELLRRFSRQTTRRRQHLEDRANAEVAPDILEHAMFAADESAMPQEPLVLTVRRFLERRPAAARASAFVSLSGGVDSMVLCKILVHLRASGAMPFEEIVAVHVDYGNRDESGAEAAYVEGWCAEHGVTCVTRVISEVRRGVTARDDYERIARELRYHTYREVLSGCVGAGMLFGHHRGDLQENVVSNVMRGCSPLALSGMLEVSVAHEVSVWRPLLPHDKDLILSFAHRYGVPYLRDTTPTWSTRGKLRTLLLPLLRDMYGEGVTLNLTQLALASDDTRALVEACVYAPFLASVQRHVCGLSVDIAPFLSQPQCFWAEALRQLMHSLAMPLVRDASVANFVELIRRKVKVNAVAVTAKTQQQQPLIWLELRKGFFSCLTTAGRLRIFRDGVFPPPPPTEESSKVSVECVCSGAVVQTAIGSWRVTVAGVDEVLSEGEGDGEGEGEGEEEYCGPSLEAVLQGAFAYRVHLRPGCRSLVLQRDGSGAAAFLCGASARKRLGGGEAKVAFRNLDPRLRAALPLLVEAEPQTITLTEDSEHALLPLPHTISVSYQYCGPGSAVSIGR